MPTTICGVLHVYEDYRKARETKKLKVECKSKEEKTIHQKAETQTAKADRIMRQTLISMIP